MVEINYTTELINLSSVRALKTLISHYLFLLLHTRLSSCLIIQREKNSEMQISIINICYYYQSRPWKIPSNGFGDTEFALAADRLRLCQR